MKRVISIMLIIAALVMALLAYIAISDGKLKKVDSENAIVYPVWNRILPDRLEVYSVKENKTYIAGYSITGYIDRCIIDRGCIFYERDSLKGGGSGTVEIKDISKGILQKSEKLDIFDYYIVSDDVIVIDYDGISKYNIESKAYDQLLINPEHDELQLLYANDNILVYYNSDKDTINVYNHREKEEERTYILGGLTPMNCTMSGNEILFIESESGYLYRIDKQKGKAERQFAAIPRPKDEDVATFSKAVMKDKCIYCNGYDGSIYRVCLEEKKSKMIFNASECIAFEATGYAVEFTEEHILIHFSDDEGMICKKENIAIDYEGNVLETSNNKMQLQQ